MDPTPLSDLPQPPPLAAPTRAWRPARGLVVSTAIALGGVVGIGHLWRSFAGPAWLAMLALLCVGHLLRAGRAGIVPVSVVASAVWFGVVRSRAWPQAWSAVAPHQDPRGWAAICALAWLATLATIAALGLAAETRAASTPAPWRLALAVLAALVLGIGAGA